MLGVGGDAVPKVDAQKSPLSEHTMAEVDTEQVP